MLEKTDLELTVDEDVVSALKNEGVEMIISNGIDRKLRDNLAAKEISSIPVLKSTVETVIDNFLNGKYNKA